MKPTVLVVVARYLPGVKSGGPIRSISNLVAALGDEIDFRIVTSDRDSGDNSRYTGIQPDQWTEVGKARVRYLSPESLARGSFLRTISAERTHFLYLNSFFSRQFSILPMLARALGMSGQRDVILAPRGEFSPGALQLKQLRKQAFIRFARQLKTYRNITWHASSSSEEADIRREFGPDTRVRIALPLSEPMLVSADNDKPITHKVEGTLRVVFLSRVVPKKNLLAALQMLSGIEGKIEFNIYGPREDAVYAKLCEEELRRLPRNISVAFRSFVQHSEVKQILGAHHLFFFPTLGENYGHVIYEALDSGCPVLISDQTPWRGLSEVGAGWDLPLDKPDLFRQALQTFVRMNNAEFQQMSKNARSFVRRFVDESNPVASNRALFDPIC